MKSFQDNGVHYLSNNFEYINVKLLLKTVSIIHFKINSPDLTDLIHIKYRIAASSVDCFLLAPQILIVFLPN